MYTLKLSMPYELMIGIFCLNKNKTTTTHAQNLFPLHGVLWLLLFAFQTIQREKRKRERACTEAVNEECAHCLLSKQNKMLAPSVIISVAWSVYIHRICA